MARLKWADATNEERIAMGEEDVRSLKESKHEIEFEMVSLHRKIEDLQVDLDDLPFEVDEMRVLVTRRKEQDARGEVVTLDGYTKTD